MAAKRECIEIFYTHKAKENDVLNINYVMR